MKICESMGFSWQFVDFRKILNLKNCLKKLCERLGKFSKNLLVYKISEPKCVGNFFLNLKIIKNLVGFFEENFFIFFRYLKTLPGFLVKILANFLETFFFFFEIFELEICRKSCCIFLKKTLWYFMKVLITLSKSRICENMLGILELTLSCVLENG